MNLQQMKGHRVALIQYMRAKIDIEDWHGVSDAANDLREIDVAIRMTEPGISFEAQRIPSDGRAPGSTT